MTPGEPEPQPQADEHAAQGRQARTALVERLFREHNESLIRFLTARIGSPQEAREVAQEAYVRLLSLDEPGAVSYLRAFLFKTAANIAVDRRRREAVHARATDTPLFQELTDARTPERRVAGEQTIERLQRLIAAMPPKCQRAFVLNEFYGMDFASIAQEMKISERMVRKYVVRALLHCRAALDWKGGGE
ncbi:MAG: sigma-70 family RNA polymerase sigma factor [Gammaproteobacteria bacterium]